jgi:erythromycin esterase
MGMNLAWQANEMYPQQKIIVWAHHVHVCRNLEGLALLDRVPGLDWPREARQQVTATEARKAFGKDAYTLMFLAAEGDSARLDNGEHRKLMPPASVSLEGLSAATGFDTFLIDFQNLDDSGGWLRERLIARPIGYFDMVGDWTRSCDGFVFTRVMNPATPVKALRRMD